MNSFGKRPKENIMQSTKVTIQNAAGIHCRPASVIINTVHSEFPNHKFTVTSPEKEVIALDSILNLISLGLQCGDEILLEVEGPQEAEACEKIAGLFAFHFDFPPR